MFWGTFALQGRLLAPINLAAIVDDELMHADSKIKTV